MWGGRLWPRSDGEAGSRPGRRFFHVLVRTSFPGFEGRIPGIAGRSEPDVRHRGVTELGREGARVSIITILIIIILVLVVLYLFRRVF